MQAMKDAPTEEGIAGELIASCPRWPEAATFLVETVDMLAAVVAADGVIFACGNGGSASDASHLVGELVKSFRHPRKLPDADRRAFRDAFGEEGGAMAERLERGIRAVSLPCSAAAMTAIGNDNGPDLVFAQQVWALARPGDAVIGLSTSGGSANVVAALRAARVRGAATIGMTGAAEAPMDALSDVAVKAPSDQTFRVQEYHLAFYHAFCAALEARVFGPGAA